MTRDNVWFLLPDFPVGGVETVTAALINGMASKGIAVTLLLCEENIEHPAFKLLDPSAKTVILHRKPGVFGYLALLAKFRQLVSKQQPKAIISAKETANIINVAACIGLSSKSIITRHVPILEEVNKAGGDSNWYTPLIFRMVNRFADKLVAVSNGIRDEIVQLLPSRVRDIQTIYNPVVDERLLERSREPITEAFWDPVKINIVAVGRLCKQKGYERLLESLKHLLEQEPKAFLTVFGEGEDREKLESLAKHLGIEKAVCFAGQVANPIKFVANARVFALSSRWEGLPTVMIEAAAVNVPVVAFDCPTGPKEIFATGTKGYLIENDNIADFSIGLKKAIRDVDPFINPIDSFLHKSAVDAYIRLF